MRIDGDIVAKGDRVFHDRYGWGTVTFVSGGVCHVKFADARDQVIFTDGGLSNGYKVLWWDKPIQVVPRKGVNYDGLKEVLESIVKLITRG